MPEPLRAGDPTRLGAYQLTARLGQGGQGVVYLGHRDSGDGTAAKVAVKVLNREWAEEPRLRQRFAKEVEAAKRVSAFCTAAVLDADLQAQFPYIVSEFIDGPSLQQAVADGGPRTGSALDRLAVATATALVAIHKAGVVHRDFKPANVLLGPDGPRVIDFGIARAVDGAATQTSSVLGTPSYMAPEQIEGGELGRPADIFAWGCVIAFAATGKAPFGSDSVPAVINRVLNGRPDLGALEEPLRGIVLACLDKRPAARPSAATLLSRLIGDDGPAPPPAPPQGGRAPTGPQTVRPGTGPQPARTGPHTPPPAAYPAGPPMRTVPGYPAGPSGPHPAARPVPFGGTGPHFPAAVRPSSAPPPVRQSRVPVIIAAVGTGALILSLIIAIILGLTSTNTGSSSSDAGPAAEISAARHSG
ncbi:serine/threonine-protein kinase [Allonocardiopsis opalescens]|uniref:Serine/threonine protein kinase n=1 Tax=Allonocardiopsis opalescens TaxID=1144618 RepID=A0A2T0PVA7_9ACTN|nr:serine/threonine-protein kinase [Allonocardiopsis opalescens]PRX95463.1 serine/threonine protein kinase [Allonocardiopsis opalescens]